MVVFCIGTPEISGDSVAPLTGDMLIERGINAYVYGTTKNPICAKNYDEYYSFIIGKHPEHAVIAIDAALGQSVDIGVIKVISGGVSPGKAVGKNLPRIGTIGILAQVGAMCDNPTAALMSVPYSHAISMAKRCADLVESLL